MVGKKYFVLIYCIKRSSQGRNKKINENLIFLIISYNFLPLYPIDITFMRNFSISSGP